MKYGESVDIDNLLKTVLVPSYPPNRSQWKKIELAMKFINKSKNCAQTQPQNGKKVNVSYEEGKIPEIKEERRNCATKIVNEMKIQENMKFGSEDIPFKRQSNWKRMKHSIQHIL